MKETSTLWSHMRSQALKMKPCLTFYSQLPVWFYKAAQNKTNQRRARFPNSGWQSSLLIIEPWSKYFSWYVPLPSDISKTCEAYICALYTSAKMPESTADQLRYWTFFQKNQKSECLPPTTDSLLRHIERCNGSGPWTQCTSPTNTFWSRMGVTRWKLGRPSNVKGTCSEGIPWVPEDIFFLSILMVRGEAGLTRKK